MKHRLLIALLIILLCSLSSYAATHYISPSGSATWANSTNSETPCSLSTANSNAVAGDIIILADGDYNTTIYPSNSGSSGNMITYQAANKWGAIIKNPSTIITNYQHGIWLRKSYIKVWGVKVDATTFTATLSRHHLLINQGAGYNEISNCWFTGIAMSQAYEFTGHVWYHDNILESTALLGSTSGGVCFEPTTGLQLGVNGASSGISYNTVENNTFYHNSHFTVETFGTHNVIRNNFSHNEGSVESDLDICSNELDGDETGRYGNRNFEIDSAASLGNPPTYNIIEGNRIGPSGRPVDQTGVGSFWGGEGLNIITEKNIFRYNEVYSAMNGGLMLKTGASGAVADNNRIYNNTIVGSGRYKPSDTSIQGGNITVYGSYDRINNIIKNNILYGYGDNGADWYIANGNFDAHNTVNNNLCTDSSARCSVVGNPSFVDGSLPSVAYPSTANLTTPNLTLQSSSNAINAGTYLTQANGSGSESTTLIVDDALFFQDGTSGSDLARGVLGNFYADWICVGTVSNCVQISSINYDTNTITLSSALTWSDDDHVWLYKKSDGTRVLYGSAPDMGAHERSKQKFTGNVMIGGSVDYD